ncbi:Glycosyl transferase family 2 [Ferrithrix thermotolerans DSM 19514]|uniref:Glycosyl transferase family 2 n=1 Tax=Ferrithrix thermotolerans DSM 19514 TaxID=1121881 RepID=A0A1M4U0C7_9ACTN|nr:glycosyltransferase family 2 protein [Ferrithrix thermotolerans]SHE50159.1 Glycosyl transferase family 2 [Ferrithrix thermotolerans DSM 19514]
MKTERLIAVILTDFQYAASCLESMKSSVSLTDRVVILWPDIQTEAEPIWSEHRFGAQKVSVVKGDFRSLLYDALKHFNPSEVAVVEDTVIVTRRWLDGLSQGLKAVPFNSLVVPRSPSIHGVQRVLMSEGAQLRSRGDLSRFAKSFSESRKGLISSERYVCSAVLHMRADFLLSLLPNVSQFSSTLELYLAIENKCNKFVVHESIVYSLFARQVEVEREQSQGTLRHLPLLSACMIVKDEEKFIEKAIESLLSVTEEIVVYDTGSSDRTVELARSLGATVIEGTWRADFAWARNQALSRCSGKWIVWIDADEILECDPVELRRELAFGDDELEGYTTRIKNEVGSGMDTPIYHWATRLFRRSECTFSGAIHETVWSRILDRSAYSKQCNFATIHHFGYLESVMTEKNKAERNLSVASSSKNFRFVEEKKVHEARSYFLSGDLERARLVADEVVYSNALESFRNLAIRVSFEARLGLGEPKQAQEMLAMAMDSSIGLEFQSYMQAMLSMAEARWEDALDALRQVGGGYLDDDGWEIVPEQLLSKQIECYVGLEDYDRAVEVAFNLLASGSFDFHLGRLVEWVERSSTGTLSKLADVVPETKLDLVFAQVLQLKRSVADRVLEEFFVKPTLRVYVLATAGLILKGLDQERARVWTDRIRAAGFEIPGEARSPVGSFTS